MTVLLNNSDIEMEIVLLKFRSPENIHFYVTVQIPAVRFLVIENVFVNCHMTQEDSSQNMIIINTQAANKNPKQKQTKN